MKRDMNSITINPLIFQMMTLTLLLFKFNSNQTFNGQSR